MERWEQLTDEQLIENINAGETLCMDVLIERYKRQVRNQARPLYLIGGDSDDLIQEGMLGLFKAIRDYRPDKSDSFEAFASLCISRQLYSAIQAAGRLKHAPLNSYVELSPELGEQADGLKGRSPEELLIDQENIRSLQEEILKAATPLEQKILEAYLNGQSYTEIAQRLGKEPKSIDNALQRIRRKLNLILFRKN
ncbi:MAG: sigma-70 family RNA polymerase sigma factor [Lachnospiraceae bacterium]|jgi:RNA polymerase sporulation-specific sigma factor|nr:sigma-70 family RNA polymerase sigma factor [Lachnospiraceae bacterium]